MPHDIEQATERTRLIYHTANDRSLSQLQHDDDASSIIQSAVTKDEAALAGSTVGERLAYNDYTTIDWLHDLVHGIFIYCCSELTVTYRSKNHTVIAQSTIAPASATA